MLIFVRHPMEEINHHDDDDEEEDDDDIPSQVCVS
jgi:hypothetical protein